MSPRSGLRRILVVGAGAREHALVTALAGNELFVAPGNPGTAQLATNVDVATTDIEGLVAFAVRERIDLVVVGPEAPLTMGLVDALEAAGITAFGPTRAASQLEGSKAFMKEFLRRHAIPTAPFRVFEDAAEAKAYVVSEGRAIVVKADGLCAGKGVVVASSVPEALQAIDDMMVARIFGDAGARVVIEDILPGEEASFHVVCDGTRGIALVAAQDHKRVFDGDRGPNTGGMGAYAPAPVVTPALQDEVMRTIVAPTLAGMAAEGAPFRGVLFVGLMIHAGRAYVIEFNVRFGDPETTVLVPMLDGSWLDLLDGAARGNLEHVHVGTRSGSAVAVVMASAGYPQKPVTGDAIAGLSRPVPEGAFVFHAGTKREGAATVTAGGRVLTVCARAESFEAAHAAVYGVVDGIHWKGEHHRKDIGHRAKQR